MTEAESFGDSFVMDKYVSDVRFKFEYDEIATYIQYCGNCRNLLSRFFEKNSVKTTFIIQSN